jgi:hypothetical protein
MTGFKGFLGFRGEDFLEEIKAVFADGGIGRYVVGANLRGSGPGGFGAFDGRQGLNAGADAVERPAEVGGGGAGGEEEVVGCGERGIGGIGGHVVMPASPFSIS